MMTDLMASLTFTLDTPPNQRWSGALPVEVRDVSKLMLAARGISDGRVQVPAGSYLVSAVLPNGQQASVNDVVVLQPGDDKQVHLSLTDLDFPATLQTTATVWDSVKDTVKGISPRATSYFTGHTAMILRGKWLAAKIDPSAAPVVTRARTAQSRIEVGSGDGDTWLEITGGNRGCLFAVPVDEGRSTTAEWDLESDTGKLNLKFDFNDGELNSFFDFVRNNQTMEARSVGQSIIAQSEQFMMDKKRSPLRAILGAYVLLRANELENMDLWTRNIVRFFPWLPDALPVRVEYLARNGEHVDAFKLLLEAPNWGTPWFRSGLSYLEKRAKIYASVAGDSDLPASADEIKKIQQIAKALSGMVTMLDVGYSTTVIRGMDPIT
jgi:hypothetical protein